MATDNEEQTLRAEEHDLLEIQQDLMRHVLDREETSVSQPILRIVAAHKEQVAHMRDNLGFTIEPEGYSFAVKRPGVA